MDLTKVHEVAEVINQYTTNLLYIAHVDRHVHTNSS